MNHTIRIVADCVVPVTAFLFGELKDWPANIQDGVYEALNRKAERDHQRTGLKLAWTVTNSKCDFDFDDVPYIHVVAVAELTIQ